MNINSLSIENLLLTQKLLQELPENKTLNLSEKQKASFKQILTEALLKSSDTKNLSDLQNQLFLKNPTLFNMINLNTQSGFLNLLEAQLDEDYYLSKVQKQLLKSTDLTREGFISPSSNIVINTLVNSRLKPNKMAAKSHVDKHNTAKAKTSYPQQIPIILSTNMGEMFSRIQQITSSFWFRNPFSL
ncbi:hypothetical protein MHI04_10155 [Lysinibacillus sp. FSL K6-1151]|uniref:hypothetical protein n=1 Tax=Lysinibacillus sp. FSL K6-1151 TaxID=2921465 RepID=UPI003159A3C3